MRTHYVCKKIVSLFTIFLFLFNIFAPSYTYAFGTGALGWERDNNRTAPTASSYDFYIPKDATGISYYVDGNKNEFFAIKFCGSGVESLTGTITVSVTANYKTKKETYDVKELNGCVDRNFDVTYFGIGKDSAGNYIGHSAGVSYTVAAKVDVNDDFKSETDNTVNNSYSAPITLTQDTLVNLYFADANGKDSYNYPAYAVFYDKGDGTPGSDTFVVRACFQNVKDLATVDNKVQVELYTGVGTNYGYKYIDLYDSGLTNCGEVRYPLYEVGIGTQEEGHADGTYDLDVVLDKTKVFAEYYENDNSVQNVTTYVSSNVYTPVTYDIEVSSEDVYYDAKSSDIIAYVCQNAEQTQAIQASIKVNNEKVDFGMKIDKNVSGSEVYDDGKCVKMAFDTYSFGIGSTYGQHGELYTDAYLDVNAAHYPQESNYLNNSVQKSLYIEATLPENAVDLRINEVSYDKSKDAIKINYCIANPSKVGWIMIDTSMIDESGTVFKSSAGSVWAEDVVFDVNGCADDYATIDSYVSSDYQRIKNLYGQHAAGLYDTMALIDPPFTVKAVPILAYNQFYTNDDENKVFDESANHNDSIVTGKVAIKNGYSEYYNVLNTQNTQGDYVVQKGALALIEESSNLIFQKSISVIANVEMYYNSTMASVYTIASNLNETSSNYNYALRLRTVGADEIASGIMLKNTSYAFGNVNGGGMPSFVYFKDGNEPVEYVCDYSIYPNIYKDIQFGFQVSADDLNNAHCYYSGVEINVVRLKSAKNVPAKNNSNLTLGAVIDSTGTIVDGLEGRIEDFMVFDQMISKSDMSTATKAESYYGTYQESDETNNMLQVQDLEIAETRPNVGITGITYNDDTDAFDLEYCTYNASSGQTLLIYMYANDMTKGINGIPMPNVDECAKLSFPLYEFAIGNSYSYGHAAWSGNVVADLSVSLEESDPADADNYKEESVSVPDTSSNAMDLTVSDIVYDYGSDSFNVKYCISNYRNDFKVDMHVTANNVKLAFPVNVIKTEDNCGYALGGPLYLFNIGTEESGHDAWTGTVTAYMDPYKVFVEADENNNEKAVQVQVEDKGDTPAFDLSIENISYDNVTDAIVIEFLTSNASSNVLADIKISTSTGGVKEVNDVIMYEGLGQIYVYPYELNITTSKEYNKTGYVWTGDITAQIDYKDEYIESSSNNSKTVPLNINDTQTYNADLYINSIAYSADSKAFIVETCATNFVNPVPVDMWIKANNQTLNLADANIQSGIGTQCSKGIVAYTANFGIAMSTNTYNTTGSDAWTGTVSAAIDTSKEYAEFDSTGKAAEGINSINQKDVSSITVPGTQTTVPFDFSITNIPYPSQVTPTSYGTYIDFFADVQTTTLVDVKVTLNGVTKTITPTALGAGQLILYFYEFNMYDSATGGVKPGTYTLEAIIDPDNKYNGEIDEYVKGIDEISNNIKKLTFTISSTSVDNDKDGFTNDVDCDDGNPSINPEAEEIVDGLDNNCNDKKDLYELASLYYDKFTSLDPVEDASSYNNDAEDYGTLSLDTVNSAIDFVNGYLQVVKEDGTLDFGVGEENGISIVVDFVSDNLTTGSLVQVLTAKGYEDQGSNWNLRLRESTVGYPNTPNFLVKTQNGIIAGVCEGILIDTSVRTKIGISAKVDSDGNFDIKCAKDGVVSDFKITSTVLTGVPVGNDIPATIGSILDSSLGAKYSFDGKMYNIAIGKYLSSTELIYATSID